MAEQREMVNTCAGLLRRTGPATAELFDPQTGQAYALDFTAFANDVLFGLEDGREVANRIFDSHLPDPE